MEMSIEGQDNTKEYPLSRQRLSLFLEAGSFYPEENIQSEIQNFGIKGMMGRRAFDMY